MNGARTDWVEFFLSSTGRLPRGGFLAGAAALVVLATLYDAVTGVALRWLTGWLVYPVLLYSGACILSKRLHDRGRSGWWAALVLAALIGVWPQPSNFFDFAFAAIILWAVVDLGIMPGEMGANRYGPNPMRAPKAVA